MNIRKHVRLLDTVPLYVYTLSTRINEQVVQVNRATLEVHERVVYSDQALRNSGIASPSNPAQMAESTCEVTNMKMLLVSQVFTLLQIYQSTRIYMPLYQFWNSASALLVYPFPDWFTRSHVASNGPQSMCFNASIVLVTLALVFDSWAQLFWDASFVLAEVSDLFQRLGGLFAVAFLHFWLWWLLKYGNSLKVRSFFRMARCKWEKQFVLRVFFCPSLLQAEIWLNLVKVALVWQRPTFSLQLSSQMGVSLGGLLFFCSFCWQYQQGVTWELWENLKPVDDDELERTVLQNCIIAYRSLPVHTKLLF